jgi:hypothetical protein
MEMEDREKPLIPFGEFEQGYHKAIHRQNIQYFRNNPRLLQRIREDLDNGDVHWELESITHRLLFVPESREPYAVLFTEYCRAVIREILAATGLENPYCEIRTLTAAESADFNGCGGISAFVVHNLAEEYVATYVFSNGEDKKIRINLNGTLYVGAVGSYTSSIQLDEEGRFVFDRDDYTVWQNSAKNPFCALVAPMEETMHIALRGHTEREIKKHIQGASIRNLKEVRPVVDEWMAVEEAAAGGLAHTLAPEIIQRYVPHLSQHHRVEELNARGGLKRYRYLNSAVDFIQNVGHRAAIDLYEEDPAAFREVLIRGVQGDAREGYQVTHRH